MKKQKRLADILFALAILILVLVVLYSGLQILESTVFYSGPESSGFVSKTITRDGVDYFPRQDITTILVLGIDQSGPVEDSGSYINPGAADMVMLLSFDETAQACDVLFLNRDTMLEMPVLGIGGRKAGSLYGQLALSHTYGSGLEDSCENTRETVSDFLYGLRIDYYVAMHMDAISILNDAVGGVTVNVQEDFSAVDSSIRMGTMTLMGEQALAYVRTRKDVGDQLNLSRIERQQKYVDGFVEAFQKKMETDDGFAIKAYDLISPYLVSDCSMNAITGMINRFSAYTVREVAKPEGQNVMGEEYFEFYVDEEALDALILRLFYAPK